MKSQLLYILITLCLFVGIGALINGMTKISGKGKNGESRKSHGVEMVATGILLIFAGLLLLYFFNDQLTE